MPKYKNRLDFVKKVLKGKPLNVFTWEFVRAAIELKLEYKFITPSFEEVEKYVEISDGKKTTRIVKAMVPLNNVVAAILAKKKPATQFLLKNAGIPVPRQIVTNNPEDPKIDKLKFPVVTKPLNLTGGTGVTAKIKDKNALVPAMEEAQNIGIQKSGGQPDQEPVIIEEMINGSDHRLLVLGDKVIAAIKKHPPVVTGDGKSSVVELIEKENQSEIRKAKQVSSIKIDNDLVNTLREQELSFGSIPEKGLEVRLHVVSNLSRGATTEDVSKIVHPKFAEIAVKAAKTIGLKLAGVDFMAEDITKDPKSQEHGIIEVNAHPGSRLHLYPTTGDPVDAPKIILQYIFKVNDEI